MNTKKQREESRLLNLPKNSKLTYFLSIITAELLLIPSTYQNDPPVLHMHKYGVSEYKLFPGCPDEAHKTSISAYIFRRSTNSKIFPHLKFDDLGPPVGSFINDESSKPQYKLYPRTGGTCMETDPNDQNPIFMGFVIKHAETCRIDYILISEARLRPCTNPTSAKDIYELFKLFDSNGASTIDNILEGTRMDVHTTYKALLIDWVYYHAFNYLDVPGGFNDELVEYLVTRASRKPTGYLINRFSESTFYDMRKAYQEQGSITFNAEQFFKKHTHNSLVGFHLEPLSRTLNPVLPKEWRITKELKAEESSHSLLFQGYISDPNSIDVGHELYIFFEVKGNNNVHKYFKYKMKITRDTVAPQLSVALYDATTNALRVEMSNWISIDDNHTPRYWLHFALCIGMGARYYKAPSSGTGIEANFKIYETMAFYYNDDIYQKITSFNADGPIQQMIPNFFDNNREADRILYHSIWIDMNSAAMTPQPGIDPGVRMFSYSQSKGAFPAPLNPKLSGTQNANPKNRCFLKTVEAHSCFAFAFLKDMEDKMDKFLLQNSYKTCNGEQTKSPRRCRYCTDNRNCLVPFQGYNRELSYSGQKSYFIPTRTASEINAAQEAQEYIDFQDNLGVNYKIRCPFGCKEF